MTQRKLSKKISPRNHFYPRMNVLEESCCIDSSTSHQFVNTTWMVIQIGSYIVNTTLKMKIFLFVKVIWETLSTGNCHPTIISGVVFCKFFFSYGKNFTVGAWDIGSSIHFSNPIHQAWKERFLLFEDDTSLKIITNHGLEQVPPNRKNQNGWIYL